MTSSAAELRPVTLVAIGAVERALELARRRVGAADITAKEGRDLVTATDVAVEDVVRTMVAVGWLPVVGERRRRAAGRRAPACSSIPSADVIPYPAYPYLLTRPWWRGAGPPQLSAILRQTIQVAAVAPRQ
jgi:hypothetical protein